MLLDDWLLQNTVAWAAVSEPIGMSALLEGERHYSAGANEKRCQDFVTGRWCARQALQQLGIEPVAIPVGPHRQPLWPAGVTGSISHTQGYYCAVASTRQRSLGLDAENLNDDINVNVIKTIFTPQEYPGRSAVPQQTCKHLFYITLTAKEAFCKSMFPLVNQYIDFKDVAVEIDYTNQLYEITLLRKLDYRYDWGMRFQGNFWINKDIILAVLSIA
jgi:4'-phosphopantetheinyl transferase EntD